MLFSVLFSSLTIVILKFNHVVKCSNSPFPFIGEKNLIIWHTTIFFIGLPFDGLSGCFHFGAFTTTVAIIFTYKPLSEYMLYFL